MVDFLENKKNHVTLFLHFTLTRARRMLGAGMCADNGEAEQVRRLLAFLEPVVSLPTQADRIKLYHETWMRLNPAAENEVWKPNMTVNFPWNRDKVDLCRTLRRDIETRLQTTLNEHLNGEITDRPIVAFSFMDYSDMLLELLDKYLKGLDRYIATQDAIDEVSRDMDAYPEDMRYLLEKGMHSSRVTRAQEFMDVILFMHAVSQRVDGQWDALDRESDVTWFREHCEVYQKNEGLMAFLRDCAVVVLLVGHLHAAPGLLSMHAFYTQLGEKALLDEGIKD
jgi:hypothetical protein